MIFFIFCFLNFFTCEVCLLKISCEMLSACYLPLQTGLWCSHKKINSEREKSKIHDFRPKNCNFSQKTHLVKVHLTGIWSFSCENRTNSHRNWSKKQWKRPKRPWKVMIPHFCIYRGQNIFYEKWLFKTERSIRSTFALVLDRSPPWADLSLSETELELSEPSFPFSSEFGCWTKIDPTSGRKLTPSVTGVKTRNHQVDSLEVECLAFWPKRFCMDIDG